VSASDWTFVFEVAGAIGVPGAVIFVAFFKLVTPKPARADGRLE
jgi:hypothetical protein